MLVTKTNWRGTTADKTARRARYGVSANTILFFPMDNAHEKELWDVSDTGLVLIDDGGTAFDIDLGVSAATQKILCATNGAVPNIGTIPTIDISRPFISWFHLIANATVTFGRFRVGSAGTVANVGLGGGPTGPTLSDGTNSLTGTIFSTSVDSQDSFRAVFVDPDNDAVYSLESTNAAAVAQKGATVALSSATPGAIGNITPNLNTLNLGQGAQIEGYGYGLSYMDGKTLAQVIADCETLRAATKLGTKTLPSGW